MPSKRPVIGAIVSGARIVGWILIALSVVSVPQMRVLTGRFAATFGLVGSVALALVGIMWLIGVELFRHFFDEFMSNN
jgi:hypothetical protein